MSREGRTPEDDDRKETIAGMAAAPLESPSDGDEELLRIWNDLKPQTPSPAFQSRMASLLTELREQRLGEADLGATLAALREAASLTIGALRQRLQIDGGVLQDLEQNAVYPETLSEAFWRRYAAALAWTTVELADLIASYDRGKIAVGGMAAARSTQGMAPAQRAAFLGEPDAEVVARLNERRDALVAALRGSG